MLYFQEEVSVEAEEEPACAFWPSALITSALGLCGKLPFATGKKKTLKVV